MTIIWTEIWTHAPEACIEFYSDLFDWTFEPFTAYSPDYFIARTDSVEQPSVALVKSPTPEGPKSRASVPYFKVDSIEVSLGRVGLSNSPIQRLPNSTERFCMIQDPADNWIGLWDHTG